MILTKLFLESISHFIPRLHWVIRSTLLLPRRCPLREDVLEITHILRYCAQDFESKTSEPDLGGHSIRVGPGNHELKAGKPRDMLKVFHSNED
ncbi:hypothetical protein NPIL_186221 [Nephila pilipes]|uniref:Uncharacterized protein n=1 Tax=Nephila pilipes TaxID=299642 RepID=A0A8X6MNH9_NEPPI|nr:hypothetical protein NPIL_186221 [Nephila pilipes]